jgi:hypothetical protein
MEWLHALFVRPSSGPDGWSTTLLPELRTLVRAQLDVRSRIMLKRTSRLNGREDAGWMPNFPFSKTIRRIQECEYRTEKQEEALRTYYVCLDTLSWAGWLDFIHAQHFTVIGAEEVVAHSGVAPSERHKRQPGLTLVWSLPVNDSRPRSVNYVIQLTTATTRWSHRPYVSSCRGLAYCLPLPGQPVTNADTRFDHAAPTLLELLKKLGATRCPEMFHPAVWRTTLQ